MLKGYAIKASKILLAIAMGAMFVVVILQVVARYVLEIPLFWSEELSRYLMIWSALLGAALGINEGVHTSVKWFLNFVPNRMRAPVMLLANILVLSFVVLAFVGSLKLMQFLKFQLSAAMQIPMVYPFLSFPVSLAVMIIVLTYDLFDMIKKLFRGIDRERKGASNGHSNLVH